ncbi:polymer-forming cytoskeletal protein [bacterium]|jgi:cytoskeletal protein CcmA (bactofilin family)|nr:polymer-forming cytoskeletal protein [bacterium]
MGRTQNLSVPVTSFQVTGVIDQGCEFEGKLCFQGTVRINGIFHGEIFTPDTLIIGEGARVQGKIDAGIVVISGEFSGSVKAKHRVEIHQPAIFRGDILTPSLKVDEGVIFEGSSKMVDTPANPSRSFLSSPERPAN